VVVAVLLLAVTAGVLSLESSAKTSAPPKPLLYRCHAMSLRDGGAVIGLIKPLRADHEVMKPLEIDQTDKGQEIRIDGAPRSEDGTDAAALLVARAGAGGLG
jgi:hypothetical protein